MTVLHIDFVVKEDRHPRQLEYLALDAISALRECLAMKEFIVSCFQAFSPRLESVSNACVPFRASSTHVSIFGHTYPK